MIRYAVVLLLVFLSIGCETVKETDIHTPPLGQGVNQVFDTMIANAEPIETQLGSVYFAFDQAELNQESKNELDKIAKRVAHLTGPVIIEGYTDHVNTVEYNEKLGLLRALTVAQYLQSAGVWEERLVLRSYGETRPAETNWTASGANINRRVDIRIMAQGEGMPGKESMRVNEKLYTEKSSGESSPVGLILSGESKQSN